MSETKTEQKTTTKENTTIKAICDELEQINQSVITKAKDNSIKDIAVTYSLEEMTTKINTANVKIVSSNYQTQKVRVTFYRDYINEKIAEIKKLSSEEYFKILSHVNKNKLFVAFNLWVSGTLQLNKNSLLE